MEENSNKELSTGSFAWGFIWRITCWTFVISFFIAIIAGLLFVTKSSHITSLDQLHEYIAHLKTNLWFVLILSALASFLECKLTLDGVIKKFDITYETAEAAIKIVTIILIIFACLYLVYTYNHYTTDFAETNAELDYASQLLKSTYNDNSIDDFKSFSNTFSIVAVAVNLVIYVLLVFFARYYINQKVN